MSIPLIKAAPDATAPILAAEFTRGWWGRPSLLTVTEIYPLSGGRVPLATHEVGGKPEARDIAAMLGATCNF